MNVLHVTASIDPKLGGVSHAVQTMVKGLETEGINNTIVSLDDEKVSFTKSAKTQIFLLGPAKGPWKYSARLMPWLKEHLHHYDIIIVHGIWLYHSYAVNNAIHSAKDSYAVKVFIMPHGMLDPYFQHSAGRKIKAIRNWLYWKIIERKVINNANGILFTCEEERQLARQTFLPYMPKREIIAGLGVDNPPLCSNAMKEEFLKKCPSAADRSYILFIGRIDEKKGVDLLINAYINLFIKLSAKQKSAEEIIDIQSADQMPLLIIAGPDPSSSFGQKMQMLAFKDSAFRNKIFFPGMLSGNEKWGAFYFCEAFILPSHQENFGIAVTEALAASKPVLISNKINIWREIKDAGAGVIAEDTLQGTEDLFNSWTILTDEEKLKMKKNARTCFELNFALARASTKLRDAITS